MRLRLILRLLLAGLLAGTALLTPALDSRLPTLEAPSTFAGGPTSVSGVISSDTTWTLADSPYIVTGNILVSPSATLTIESGVAVNFQGRSLQVAGTLVARGTSGSPITFTGGSIIFADTSTDATFDANGNYTGGSIVEYAIFEQGGHSKGQIELDGSEPFINYSTFRKSATHGIYFSGNPRGFGSVRVTNNTIMDNYQGGIYSTGPLTVIGNIISNNGWSTSAHGGLYRESGPYGGAATVSNNVIMNNKASAGGGINITEWGSPVIISSNIIMGNQAGGAGGGVYLLGGGRLDIIKNIIVGNRAATGGGIAYSRFGSGSASITGNLLSNNSASTALNFQNEEMVAFLHHNTIVQNGPGSSAVQIGISTLKTSEFSFWYNNVFNNRSTFALQNNTARAVNAENNWWGTSSESEIQGKIYDWDNDTTKGFVDYSPYLTSPDTTAPVSPPSNVVITAGVSGPTLTWSANPESDVAGYKVYYDMDSSYPYSNVIDAGKVISYTLTGLNAAVYYAAVTAYDSNRDGVEDWFDGNESWFSTEVVVDLRPPPASVQPLPPYVGANAPISWTVPITWTGTSATSYDVQYRDGPSGAWTDVVTSTTSTATTFSGQDGRTYYFRARSRTAAGAIGDWSEAVSTTVDLTAPVGSLAIEGGAAYASSMTATLALTAADAASGVAEVSFSNDSSAWSNWDSFASSKPWALASGPDGPRTAYARFRDTAGNVSLVYSDTILLDTTAPTGTVAINGGASITNSPAVTLTLAAADALSGVASMRFSNDGQSYTAWEDYATSKGWTLTGSDGLRAIYVQYRDAAGNASSPYTDTILLDTTPPSSSVQALAPYLNSTSFTVSWSGSDVTSGLSTYDVQYRDGPAGSWTDLITATALLSTTFSGQEGHTYYFRSRATDVAGNVEPYGGADTYTTLDLTPPSGSLALNGGAAYTNNPQVTADLSATDSLSGLSQVSFSNDGATYEDWRGYSSRFSVTLPQGDGEKTLYARFQDRAGNVSSPASDSIVLDTTPPTTPAPDDGLTGPVPSPTVSFQWPAASDALSGVDKYYYRVDCAGETATTALTATTASLPDGDHAFYVRARDGAGNYSPYGKHVFTIKATNLDSPDLYAPDSPTDRDRINVSGVGPAKTPIRLYLNCAYHDETQSGNYGAWQFREVPLALGENVIVASIVDSGGGLSPISMPAVVVRLKTLTGSPIKSAVSLLTPSGGSVSAGRHAVEVPGGALPGEAQVVVTPYGTEGAPPVVGKRSIGAFASITARERGTGAPAQLQKSVRISLGYDPQSLGGVLPSQLSVHYYDPDTFTWVALPSQVDTANRRVTAETSHFSDFALLADLPPMPVKVYLPLVPRAAGGW